MVELGAKSERDGTPDRAGETVDHAHPRLATRLDPLPELAAIGHENAAAIEERLERGAHPKWMHGRPRAATQRIPLGGHGGPRGLDLGAPVAPARGQRCRLASETHSELRGVGDEAESDPAALIERLRVPVDLHEAAAGRKGRRPAEADSEDRKS